MEDSICFAEWSGSNCKSPSFLHGTQLLFKSSPLFCFKSQVHAEPEEIIDDVLNKAQEAFNVLLVSVVSSSGLLDITRSLQDEGVQDEDRLLCVVDRPVPFNEFSLCFGSTKIHSPGFLRYSEFAGTSCPLVNASIEGTPMDEG